MKPQGFAGPAPLRRHLCGWLAASVGASWIGGCALPKPEVTTPLTVTIDADAEINTNEKGNPSPVVLRLYELTATETFERASFFELLDGDTAKLGTELVAKREFEIKPGETKVLTRDSPAATRHLGVIAGFREITAAEWRAIVDVKPDQDNAFLLSITATTVTLRRAPRSSGF